MLPHSFPTEGCDGSGCGASSCDASDGFRISVRTSGIHLNTRLALQRQPIALLGKEGNGALYWPDDDNFITRNMLRYSQD